MKGVNIVVIKIILLNVLYFLKTGDSKKKIIFVRSYGKLIMFIFQIYKLLIDPTDSRQLFFSFLFLCAIIKDLIQKREHKFW
jgi:hypothetical protein